MKRKKRNPIASSMLNRDSVFRPKVVPNGKKVDARKLRRNKKRLALEQLPC